MRLINNFQILGGKGCRQFLVHLICNHDNSLISDGLRLRLFDIYLSLTGKASIALKFAIVKVHTGGYSGQPQLGAFVESKLEIF
jgi:hypothetical protein